MIEPVIWVYHGLSPIQPTHDEELWLVMHFHFGLVGYAFPLRLAEQRLVHEFDKQPKQIHTDRISGDVHVGTYKII